MSLARARGRLALVTILFVFTAMGAWAAPTAALVFSKPNRIYMAQSLAVTATFSDEITPTAATITITGTTGGASVTAVEMTETSTRTVWTYSTTVQTGDTQGTHTLTLGASDAEGNPLTTQPFQNTFQIDTGAPTATLTYSKTNRRYKAQPFLVTATFSENITPTAPTITISGTTGGTSVSAVQMTQASTRTVWTYSTNIQVPDTQGPHNITLSATDPAGNTLTAQPSLNVFAVDTTAPTAALTYSKESRAYGAEPFVVTATFSEPITPMAAGITITGTTGGTSVAAVQMTQTSTRSIWTYSTTLQITDTQGTHAIFLGAADPAGNLLPPPPPQNTFQVATCGITATLTYDKPNRIYPAGPLHLTATFSEDITPTTPTITITGITGGVSIAAVEMTTCATRSAWTFSTTIQSGDTHGIHGVAVGISDAEGNSFQFRPPPNVFIVDTEPQLEVSSGTHLIRDVLQVVDGSRGEIFSIFNTETRTVVAPVCATDQGLAFIISNPNHHALVSTLHSVGTTATLITTKLLFDAPSQALLHQETVDGNEFATQTLSGAIPMYPTTVALSYVFDRHFDWRELPSDVRYTLILYSASTGRMLDYVENIAVTPRTPSLPEVQVTSPALERKYWEGTSITLSCTAVDAFDGPLTGTALLWRRPDIGVFGAGQTVTVTSWQAGQYPVFVEATNSAWVTTSTSVEVTLYPPQPPYSITITAPTSGLSVPYGQSVSLSALVSDVVDAEMDGGPLSWLATRESGVAATGRTTSHVFTQPLTNTILLSATNSIGLTAEATVTIQIEAPVPAVAITAPETGAKTVRYLPTYFQGNASAPPEGPLTGGWLTWSSSLDGVFAQGESVWTTSLTTGVHTITLTAETPYGRSAETTTSIEVLADLPPSVVMHQPVPTGAYYETIPIAFTAYGYDTSASEMLPSTRFTWTSSIDGEFGTGASIWNDLSTGTHVITAIAHASNQTTAATTISIEVHPVTSIPPPQLTIHYPQNNSTHFTGEGIQFLAGGFDGLGEGLPVTACYWSSDLQGGIAEADSGQWTPLYHQLTTGTHTISAAVHDRWGKGTTATVSVDVQDGTTKPAGHASISDPCVNWTYPLNTWWIYSRCSPIYENERVIFQGQGFDWNSHGLRDANYHWYSDLQGLVAEGATASTTVLTAGVHNVTLVVTDNRSQTTSASVELVITTRPPPLLTGLLPSALPPYGDARIARTAYHGNPMPYLAKADDLVEGPVPVTVNSSLEGYLFTDHASPPAWWHPGMLWNGPGVTYYTEHTSHEMRPGVHVLTLSTVNSRAMTASTTYAVQVLPLEPQAIDPWTRWDSWQMDLDVDPAFIEDYTPHVGMYSALSPPYYRVTTSTIGVRSRIYGQPTTVTVNGVICPTTYNGVSATLSATTVSLVTGTNDIIIHASRGAYTVTATHHIIYKDEAVNHLPTVDDITISRPFPSGILRVDYTGHDEEWDFCTPCPEFSLAPASTATEGDWYEAGPTGTCYAVTWNMCSRPYYIPDREFAPRDRFLFEDPNYFYTTVPGTMPGTERGGNYLTTYAYYEGPVWMRLRAFDGVGYGPFTTVTAAIPYDSMAPRGATDLQIVGQSAGEFTAAWTPAEDLNFDTYRITVDYTDRWSYPPVERHIVFDRSVAAELAATSTSQFTATSVPTDVNAAVVLYALDTFGNVTGGVYAGNYAYLRTSTDLTNCYANTDRFNPAPNPYAAELPTTMSVSYQVATSGTLVARVFPTQSTASGLSADLAIRTDSTAVGPGPGTFSWNGRTNGGELVDDGAYAVRLEFTNANGVTCVSNTMMVNVAY